jgi:hypothetical protein
MEELMPIYNQHRDWGDAENKARIKRSNDDLHDLADDDSFVDVKIKEDNTTGTIRRENHSSSVLSNNL